MQRQAVCWTPSVPYPQTPGSWAAHCEDPAAALLRSLELACRGPARIQPLSAGGGGGVVAHLEAGTRGETSEAERVSGVGWSRGGGHGSRRASGEKHKHSGPLPTISDFVHSVSLNLRSIVV